MTRRIAVLKYAAATVAVFVAIHYQAKGVSWLEDEIVRITETKKAEALELAASRFGYERIQPEPLPVEPEDLVEREAVRQKLSACLVRAVWHAESRKGKAMISPKGAIGHMQLMPATLRWCGHEPLDGARDDVNFSCGARKLRDDVDATSSKDERGRVRVNLIAALERYNGGPSCIGGRCSESRNFAAEVIGYMALDPECS